MKTCHIDILSWPVPGPHLLRYRTGGMVLCLVRKTLKCFCLLLQGDAEESLTSPAYDLPQRVRTNSIFYSVADPDSNPDPDPHVFAPPGSGSLFRGMDSDPDPSIIMQK